MSRLRHVAPWGVAAIALLIAGTAHTQTLPLTGTAVEITTPTSAPITDYEGAAIQSIDLRVVGRQATSEKLLRKSLRSRADRSFDAGIFENDIQRIKNYEIFRSVTGAVYDAPGGVTLDVIVEDRWTIIPVFRPAVGAGVKVIKLGYRDSNFLGRNHDLALFAGPYLSNAENSYVVGFESTARQFAGRHELVSSGGRDFFVDSYYDYTTGGAITDIRVLTLQGESMFWLQRFDFQKIPVFPGIGVMAYNRKYTLLRGIAPPDGVAPESTVIRPRLAVRIGRVDFDNYRYAGQDLQIAGFRQFSVDGTPGFWGGELEGRLFLRPHARINLALRARVDVRNNVHTADDVTYGGFDRVRGFPFNWIRGTRGGLLNNEMRVLIHDSLFNALFLQGVLLYDVGVAGRDGDARVAQSLGLGTRIAVIPVFGMFSRLDVARSLTDGSLSVDINLGIKEFF